MNKKQIWLLAAGLVVAILLGILIALGGDSQPGTEETADTSAGTSATTEESIFGLESWDDTQPGDSIQVIPTTDDQEATQPSSEGIVATQPVETETPTKPIDPTEATVQVEQTQPTQPEQQQTEPSAPQEETKPDGHELTYEEYLKLDDNARMAFIESFESTKAYFEWYEKAMADYNDGTIPVIDGDIDLSGNKN